LKRQLIRTKTSVVSRFKKAGNCNLFVKLIASKRALHDNLANAKATAILHYQLNETQ